MSQKGIITIVVCALLILALILIARRIAPGAPTAAGFVRASAAEGAAPAVPGALNWA